MEVQCTPGAPYTCQRHQSPNSMTIEHDIIHTELSENILQHLDKYMRRFFQRFFWTNDSLCTAASYLKHWIVLAQISTIYIYLSNGRHIYFIKCGYTTSNIEIYCIAGINTKHVTLRIRRNHNAPRQPETWVLGRVVRNSEDAEGNPSPLTKNNLPPYGLPSVQDDRLTQTTLPSVQEERAKPAVGGSGTKGRHANDRVYWYCVIIRFPLPYFCNDHLTSLVEIRWIGDAKETVMLYVLDMSRIEVFSRILITTGTWNNTVVKYCNPKSHHTTARNHQNLKFNRLTKGDFPRNIIPFDGWFPPLIA